jgi:hypothetical protein
MIAAPPVTSVAILLGLSLFLGLAFEDFFARTETKRPGGIRTFPMLAFAGGVLYLFDPQHFVPFTGGLLVLGAWLAIYYRRNVRELDGQAEPNVGLVVPVLNVQAYLLGAVTLALPPWVAVTMTVASVLLLTGRERLHALARRIELTEIVTAGEFLILTGIVLPLLPSEPVTTLTSITPRQAWLGGGLQPLLRQLSGAALLDSRRARLVDGRARRALFVDSGNGRVGAAGRDRRGHAAPGAGRHHARDRHHVYAHSRGRSVLQLDAGA